MVAYRANDNEDLAYKTLLAVLSFRELEGAWPFLAQVELSPEEAIVLQHCQYVTLEFDGEMVVLTGSGVERVLFGPLEPVWPRDRPWV